MISEAGRPRDRPRRPRRFALGVAGWTLAWLGVLAGVSRPAQAAPARLLIDTDLGADCDDAGALAVAHALADKGEAELLGIGFCTAGQHGPAAIAAINLYAGRPGLPVAAPTTPQPAGNDAAFARALAETFPRVLPVNGLESVVGLYRRVLASSADATVTVVALGPLSNLDHLLSSGPDGDSPLDGVTLVSRKVNRLVVMGGVFGGTVHPQGAEWNFSRDPRAARLVLQRWPTPVWLSGWEIGRAVTTGERLYTETPAANPVRRAYALYTGGTGRPSYDQTAVLVAVRGPGDRWSLSAPGWVEVAANGANTFLQDDAGHHRFLAPALAVPTLARRIEDLMVTAPAHSGVALSVARRAGPPGLLALQLRADPPLPLVRFRLERTRSSEAPWQTIQSVDATDQVRITYAPAPAGDSHWRTCVPAGPAGALCSPALSIPAPPAASSPRSGCAGCAHTPPPLTFGFFLRFTLLAVVLLLYRSLRMCAPVTACPRFRRRAAQDPPHPYYEISRTRKNGSPCLRNQNHLPSNPQSELPRCWRNPPGFTSDAERTGERGSSTSTSTRPPARISRWTPRGSTPSPTRRWRRSRPFTCSSTWTSLGPPPLSTSGSGCSRREDG